MSLKFLRYTDPAFEPFWAQAEDWLANPDPDRDEGERSYGPRSSRAWFYRNNFDEPSDSLYGSEFGIDERDRVVTHACLVHDDRGMLAKNGIAADGMWGLVLTHHDHRKRGYGFAQCAHIDNAVQTNVNSTGIPQAW